MDRKRSTLQFRIALVEIEPVIWRRIEVPASYSFWDLHVAIQDAMGWLDYHLHLFSVRNPGTGRIDKIGIPDAGAFEGDVVHLPGWEIPMRAYFERPGDHADYEYDFGDDWQHEIVLEAVRRREPGTRYPRCLAGARACPPEDCGGVHGYAEVLTTIADPDHEEYASTLQWLGGSYDPEAFDPPRVRFADPKKRWKTAFGGQ